MIYSLITAYSKNRVIGKNNAIPWRLPIDMKFFKEKTINKVVVMGSKTFESLGNKPLSERFNVVLTSKAEQMNIQFAKTNNLIFVENFESIFSLSEREIFNKEYKEIVFIGGQVIYQKALDSKFITRMYITELDRECDGDTFFPEFNLNDWKLSSSVLDVVDSRSYFTDDSSKTPIKCSFFEFMRF